MILCAISGRRLSAVFFGGNWQDAVVSGILGMILMFLERLLGEL